MLLKNDGKNDLVLVISYGSQTGNAQDLAERIWRRVKQTSPNMTVYLSSCDQINLNSLVAETSKTVLVCVCATCGQGDFPDNMQTFWRSIMRKSLPQGLFSNLK